MSLHLLSWQMVVALVSALWGGGAVRSAAFYSVRSTSISSRHHRRAATAVVVGSVLVNDGRRRRRRRLDTAMAGAATTTSSTYDDNDNDDDTTDQSPFQITTPIYYVNDKPHIGHAYTTVACDVMARFMRLSGRPVWFQTGTDEHGQKVEQSAQLSNRPPQEFVDAVSTNFRDLMTLLHISNDKFVRTTEEQHKQSVQVSICVCVCVCVCAYSRPRESGRVFERSVLGFF
jgi:hypothetical protein